MLFDFFRWLKKRWRRLPCWIEHDWRETDPKPGGTGNELQCKRCYVCRYKSDV